MSSMEWVQIALYFGVLLLCAPPLGSYMAAVYEGRVPRLVGWLRPVENAIYRVCGVRAEAESTWRRYVVDMLLFHLAGFVVLYGLQRIQSVLPLNPAGLGAVSPDSAFNTAVSFVTNTNWQGYGGEATMSYLTQMVGLTTQNFVSAASGMAILVALIRGLVRRQASQIGNFWVDLTRSTVYILLPLSVVSALVLVSEGVVQTFSSYAVVPLLQPTTDANGATVMEQTIALGPAVPSKQRATWTRCCWTRPGRSRWATDRRRSFCRPRAFARRIWRTRLNWHRSPTRRRKVAAS